MATAGRRTRVALKVVERGCLTGYGSTVREARADLDRKIDRAVAGGYAPFVVSWGSCMALGTREPHGWCYRIIDPDRLAAMAAPGGRNIPGGSSGWFDSREACLDLAAFHVLDIGLGPHDFHSDSDIPDWLADPARRSTLLGNARFRRAWRFARDNAPDGIDPADSNQLHRWGCEHSGDPRFA